MWAVSYGARVAPPTCPRARYLSLARRMMLHTGTV